MSTTRATLKPYLNEIRGWVGQGRTDVWIAHALNSTPASIAGFRRQNGILRRDQRGESLGADVPPPVVAPDAPPEETTVGRPRRRSRSRKPGIPATPLGQAAHAMAAALPEPVVVARAAASEQRAAEDDAPRKRRRRGGRGRNKRPAGYEAVLDHGGDGYGFWIDAAVASDPVFAEHWADVRALIVRVEADQIVIRPDPRAT